MQQAKREGYDLNRLILDLSGLSDEEIEAVGRQYYLDTMLDDARRGIRFTHDNQEVKFWERRFDHSCFESPNKIRIEKARVARLPWILPIVAGNIADCECLTVPNGTRPDNRLYIAMRQNFLIWLEPRDVGGWKYSTHYTATREYVRRQQRTGKRIWKF